MKRAGGEIITGGDIVKVSGWGTSIEVEEVLVVT